MLRFQILCVLFHAFGIAAPCASALPRQTENPLEGLIKLAADRKAERALEADRQRELQDLRDEQGVIGTRRRSPQDADRNDAHFARQIAMSRELAAFDWSSDEEAAADVLQRWADAAKNSDRAAREQACAMVTAELDVKASTIRNSEDLHGRPGVTEEQRSAALAANYVADVRRNFYEHLKQLLDRHARGASYAFPSQTDFLAKTREIRALGSEGGQARDYSKLPGYSEAAKRMTPEQMESRLVEIARRCAELEVQSRTQYEQANRNGAQSMFAQFMRQAQDSLWREQAPLRYDSVVHAAVSEWASTGTADNAPYPKAWALICGGRLYRASIATTMRGPDESTPLAQVFAIPLEGKTATYLPQHRGEGVIVQTATIKIEIVRQGLRQTQHDELPADALSVEQLAEMASKIFDLKKM